MYKVNSAREQQNYFGLWKDNKIFSFSNVLQHKVMGNVG